MARRAVNATERYLLATYQHLMPPADRMIAQSLVAADFDLDRIPRGVWQRVSHGLSGRGAMGRFEDIRTSTPKAFANFSPGQRPGYRVPVKNLNPERVRKCLSPTHTVRRNRLCIS